MTSRDRRRYEMLTRVRNFAATHEPLFPETSTAHEAFATVAVEIERLEALDVAERSASQASRVERKLTARRLLSDTLTRAGFTARVLAKTNPQLEARIDLPLPRNDFALLMLARHFAASAAPWPVQFAGHGILVADVQGRITAFEQALHQRGRGRDERVKARAEIEASFTRALDAIAALDSTVANNFTADPVALAVWRHDRRVEVPRRGSMPTVSLPAPLRAPAPVPPLELVPGPVPAAEEPVDTGSAEPATAA
jgi:hypothetical protein